MSNQLSDENEDLHRACQGRPPRQLDLPDRGLDQLLLGFAGRVRGAAGRTQRTRESLCSSQEEGACTSSGKINRLNERNKDHE